MILITGVSGKLGREIHKFFPNALTPTSKEMDITDSWAVELFFRENSIDSIIHCAALTDAKICESNHQLAWVTNVEGTRNLVNAWTGCGKFVYISTPAVFKCDRGGYSEYSLPDPVNYYGLTKLLGEQILRGRGNKNWLIIRTNFISRARWIHSKAFVDRYGTYLWTFQVAMVVKELLEVNMTGVLHVCGDRKLSIYEMAKKCPNSVNVQPMTMEEYEGPPLPLDMSLITKRWHAHKIACVDHK